MPAGEILYLLIALHNLKEITVEVSEMQNYFCKLCLFKLLHTNATKSKGHDGFYAI